MFFKCGVPIPVVGPLRMVLLFARGSALHVLLLDDHHATNECVLSAVA